MILRGGGLIFDIWGENEKFNSKRQVCSSILMVLTKKKKNFCFFSLITRSLKYPRLEVTNI